MAADPTPALPAMPTSEDVTEFEIGPEDLKLYLPDADASGEVWENNGWLLRLEATTGEEFMLWSCLYALKGRPGGNITVANAAFPQTLLTYGAFRGDERGRMHDLPFIAGGVHHSEYRELSDLKVTTDDKASTWEVGGRVHRAAPPYWYLQGTSAGVTLDLELEAAGPASRVGAFRFIQGLELTARARGSIEVDGRRYDVRGWGQHEKFHLPDPDMLHAAQGFGPWKGGSWWQWHCGFSEELQVFLQLEPVDGAGYGRVLVDGELYVFDYADVTCEETEYWDDPRNGVAAPSRWQVSFRDGRSRLELEANAFSRVYYLWDYTAGGYNLLYWSQGQASGTFWSPDGREVPFANMKYLAHTKRNFLRFPSSP